MIKGNDDMLTKFTEYLETLAISRNVSCRAGGGSMGEVEIWAPIVTLPDSSEQPPCHDKQSGP